MNTDSNTQSNTRPNTESKSNAHPNSQANVDPSEINKFSELASRWWDKESEFKPLHQINPMRLNYINEHSPLNGKRVLDVGCGGGILSESMAQQGAIVTGIDMGEAPLSVARLHALESEVDVTYRKITAEALVQELSGDEKDQWDIVTCLEMLEHVPDPSSVVDACSKLVKPGGSVYFSTINRNPKSFLLAVIGAEYILNLLPKGTHQYEKFIKPSELGNWCEESELSLDAMTGMHYNPLTQVYRSGDGVDVNYLMHTLKL
ncbi:MAG: bifunctional 2-polyprenyl-6-hydroxyphenol methylase/3-demethylubiquinol 3-O-methyltransferase UbiG [Gammaproteobacteria bacterium]|nr:bifunctional 2-polyprenyl-6-hydroxyphenol methylase/3-demethylubiquinol 3-O-methyltransferase UbiG [Gammaproteobacteria bacterium]